MHKLREIQIPDAAFFKRKYSEYLGAAPGGTDLLSTIATLPEGPLENILASILALKDDCPGGRIFFIGNGGSFDNALALASFFRKEGFNALVPGRIEDYKDSSRENGYGNLFKVALESSNACATDILVTLSGSGNSPNIIAALEFAHTHKMPAFALGGRDGGEAARIAGENFSIVAVQQSMEAIEDAHLVVGLLALRAAGTGCSIGAAKKAFIEDFKTLLTDRNLSLLAELGSNVLRTFAANSRIFVLGETTGANHIISDFGRGASIGIPARGLCALDLPSMNAWQATSNDAGYGATLIHWMVKHSPSSADAAILISSGPADEVMIEPKNYLLGCKTPFVEVGTPSGLDLSAFTHSERDFISAMIGHSTGEIIRGILQQQFRVKARPEICCSFRDGWRQLSKEETLCLEDGLRKDGRLAEGRVLVFAYGSVYEADDPALFGLERNFYQ